MRTSIDARSNLDLIEENYRRWQENPESVDSGWSAFFEGFELGDLPQRDGAAVAEAEVREAALQTRVDGLIYAYCSLGHTVAQVDPLAEKRPQNPLLSLRELGFRESDLDLRVSSKFFLDNRSMVLRDMLAGLERIYADSIGSEFMHIQDPRVREWIRKRLETRPHKHSTLRAVQVALLRTLLEAESFETFLHTRYVGQKR
ncbi:MAG: 2-oxoglutarate dehydrogenase E1 component, partial [Verrucomicrobia bacterium]